MFQCPSCAHTALMPTPMLYQDDEKRLLISFSPCNDSLVKGQLYDNVCKASKDSGELRQFEGYNLRFVTDYNEILEKILIFDNDLNDKTIEVLKLMILSQDLEKSGDRICRFGKIENDIIEFMIYDEKEKQTYTSNVPKETYDVINENLRESGVKPYSFGWEIVDTAYATKLLNGVNN